MLAVDISKFVRNPAVEQFLEERKNDFHCTLQDLVVKRGPGDVLENCSLGGGRRSSCVPGTI
jgi:hypothetical protein